jgi:uncharacterized membrane protein YedE/YeeE
MTESRQRVALTAGLGALVATVAASATTLGPAARRMPLVVAVPTLALLLFELTRQVRAAPRASDSETARRAEAVSFAWLVALVAGVWLLGMQAGLPLFLVTYLRTRSHESWTTAIGMAAGVWAVLFGVLDRVLGIQMHAGAIGSWIGLWQP